MAVKIGAETGGSFKIGAELVGVMKVGTEIAYRSTTTPPPVPTFFETLIARADCLTAAEGMTRAQSDVIKYRQNIATNIGTLVNEFVAPTAPATTPLVRGLRTNNNTHIELRQYNGDLTGRGGLDWSGSGWVNWPPIDSSVLEDGIYIIDLTESVWFALAPFRRNSRSTAWCNWSGGIRLESWESSFVNNGTAATYMEALRTTTTERHMVMAVLDNHDYVPTF